MATLTDTTYHRFQNQQISQNNFKTPESVVRYMCAMQGQDFYASLWAVGIRTSALVTQPEVEQAIADAKIVRTWPMRGTLHLVAPEDARWMLKLLTPRVIKSFAGRFKELELDKSVLNKSRKIIEKALQEQSQLTRPQIYSILEEHRIPTDGQRGYHILWHLAQLAVIIFGPRRGKQHTFVLFDELIDHNRDLKGDEALAELATRYINSRGPVTEYDFSYWAGLKVSTAREAFRMAEDQVEKAEIKEHQYWFPAPALPSSSNSTFYSDKPYLLPAFDEMICGYKERSAILDSEYLRNIFLRNGIIRPVIILKGKAAGTWKRTLKKASVVVEIDLFRKISKKERKDIEKAVNQYGAFLNRQVEFH